MFSANNAYIRCKLNLRIIKNNKFCCLIIAITLLIISQNILIKHNK